MNSGTQVQTLDDTVCIYHRANTIIEGEYLSSWYDHCSSRKKTLIFKPVERLLLDLVLHPACGRGW